jgi:uncharacterized damage-inducible protein DinB
VNVQHVTELERLYDYNYWANKRMFAVIEQLTPDEFGQSVAGSYGSVRNTLVHVLSAEWGWLERCGGPPRGPRLEPADYPTPQSLVAKWNMVEQSMREYLSTLSDADLSRDIEFSFTPAEKHSVPMGRLLQHAAVHGVHHRGQVALLLRALGRVPGNFDLVIFDQEASG